MCFDVGTLNDAPQILDRVFFEGSVALAQGTALCFNQDYGTATSVDDSRARRVELPNSTNHNWFAGVVTQAYAANPAGQWVTIARPGSVVQVLADGATTIGNYGGFLANDAGSLSTQANVGVFSVAYNNGLGVGTVQYLQTIGSAGLCQACILPTGPQVGGIEVFTAAAAAVVSPLGTSVIARASGVQTTNGLTLADGTFVGQTKRLIITGGTSDATHLNLGADKGKRPPHDVGGALAIEGVTWDRFVSGTSGTDRWTQVWDGEFWRVTLTNAAQGKFTNV